MKKCSFIYRHNTSVLETDWQTEMATQCRALHVRLSNKHSNLCMLLLTLLMMGHTPVRLQRSARPAVAMACRAENRDSQKPMPDISLSRVCNRAGQSVSQCTMHCVRRFIAGLASWICCWCCRCSTSAAVCAVCCSLCWRTSSCRDVITSRPTAPTALRAPVNASQYQHRLTTPTNHHLHYNISTSESASLVRLRVLMKPN